jgi:predicted  nucleic acid-binding Zn-ribbon protein
VGMGSDGGLAEAGAAVESVADRVAKLEKECRAFQETVSSHTSRWHADSELLSKQAVALVAAMKELERDMYAASERKEISHYAAEKVPFHPHLLLTSLISHHSTQFESWVVA